MVFWGFVKPPAPNLNHIPSIIGLFSGLQISHPNKHKKQLENIHFRKKTFLKPSDVWAAG